MKKLPKITSDQEAEQLVEGDLSDLDFTQFKSVQFEFQPKNKQVNLRMSEPLLQAIKKKSSDLGISYQRYIRQALEKSLIEP